MAPRRVHNGVGALSLFPSSSRVNFAPVTPLFVDIA